MIFNGPGTDKYAYSFYDHIPAEDLAGVTSSIVNFSRYPGDPIRYGADNNGVLDSTNAIKAAINQHIKGGPPVIIYPGLYQISGIVNMGDQNNLYSGLQIIGYGLPIIQSTNTSQPILGLCGVVLDIFGIKFQYSTQPDNTHTNAVAIRTYNLAYSRITHCWATSVYGMLDQYQGAVTGGQAAFFSNSVDNLLCQQFSGVAYNLSPFSGVNSGNRWSNIYANNNVDGVPSHSLACLGGMILKGNDDTVINQLNFETMKSSGPLLVLNQAGSIAIHGLHLEGNYPTTAFAPLVDVLGGGGVSAPQINGVTLAGNDWTGFGGVNQGAFIRLDSNGSRVSVKGVNSRNNTVPANLVAVFNGGATCFGSYAEFDSVNDNDGSLSSDSYTPKASFGSITNGVEIPIQRWNLMVRKHSAMVTDNAGGTATATFTMTGTNPNGTDNDAMGLWTVGSTLFTVKQSGIYLATATIPTGTSPVIQIKKNGSVVATIAPSSNQQGGSAQVSASRGDTIQFVLASGSYTRTGVTFGISL